jgi:hypothetical protein
MSVKAPASRLRLFERLWRNAMKPPKILILAAAFAVFGVAGIAQADDDPFGGVPYRNPKPLQDLLSLDDTQFQNAVRGDFGRIRALLDAHLPPATLTDPLPRNIAGPRNVCLREHQPSACRVHLQDVLQIERDKEARGAAVASPFSNAR